MPCGKIFEQTWKHTRLVENVEARDLRKANMHITVWSKPIKIFRILRNISFAILCLKIITVISVERALDVDYFRFLTSVMRSTSIRVTLIPRRSGYNRRL